MLLFSVAATVATATTTTTDATSGPSFDVNALGKIDRNVWSQIQQLVSTGKADSLVRVTIETSTGDYGSLRSAILNLGGVVHYEFKNINAMASSVPASSITDLALNQEVQRIYLDQETHIQSSSNGYETNTAQGNYEVAVSTSTGITKMPTTEVVSTDIEGAGSYYETIDLSQVPDIIQQLPQSYINYMITGAEQVWGETNMGLGTTVAVIDTGVYADHPLIAGSVIGGINLFPGEDPNQWSNVSNHWHGTFCSSVIASHAYLVMLKTHPWAKAVMMYSPQSVFPYPGNPDYVRILMMGMAPLASIYAIKVFSSSGAPTPDWVVMAGIDYAIQLKKSGAVDINVISMSLGGASMYDGRTPEELLVDAASNAGILVSIAAGNEGPAPVTVAAPGSSSSSITVGAAADPIHSRVGFEIVYRSLGIPGIGQLLYPYDTLQIVDFSSRGPTADFRIKPEIVATGFWVMGAYHMTGYVGVAIGGGTSFSTPAVAGAGALLIAYAKSHDLQVVPKTVKYSLILGADKIPGFSIFDEGAGYINVANALGLFKLFAGTETKCIHSSLDGKYVFNFDFAFFHNGVFESKTDKLAPGQHYDLFIPVSKRTDALRIIITDFQAEENQDPIFGDTIDLYVHGSQRGGTDEYFVNPAYIAGDSEALIYTSVGFEPGIVRLVLMGDINNWGKVSASIRVEKVEVSITTAGQSVTMFNTGVKTTAGLAVFDGRIQTYSAKIVQDQNTYTWITLPENLPQAIFQLSWKYDWSMWPTNDVDMLLLHFNADGQVDYVNTDGASVSSPETVILQDPLPGQWLAIITGYSIYSQQDNYQLQLTTFNSMTPLWFSGFSQIGCFKSYRPPVHGLAAALIYDPTFNVVFLGDYKNF